MQTNGVLVLLRRPARQVIAIALTLVLLFWLSSVAREGFRQLLNPAALVQKFPVPFATLVLGTSAAYLGLRHPAAQHLEAGVLRGLTSQTTGNRLADAAPASTAFGLSWLTAGMIVVAVACWILERLEPFYFVQDDAFAVELPGILQGCRAIATGELPQWNPDQLLGIPSMGEGVYSLLYPPTFGSYAVARWGLGSEFYTLDVFAIGHLLVGFCVTFWLARKVGLRPALAMSLALSFVLSGYILTIGRSWHTIIPLVVWLPLLVLAIHQWLQGRATWRWLLTASLASAALYYVGFPQLWFYGMLFVAIAAAAGTADGRLAWRQLVWPVAACLLALAMILPQLLVQLEITTAMVVREPPNRGSGFGDGLLATMIPYPVSQARGFMPSPLSDSHGPDNQRYFAGTPLMAAGWFALGGLLAFRWRPGWLAQTPWLLPALAALWIGLGIEGRLWSLFGVLPIFRTVNHHPHRILPFFLLFALLSGGVFIERILRGGTSRHWERVIAVAVVALMLYHVTLCKNSLFNYGDRPYPALSRVLADRILPGNDSSSSRIWYCGPVRSHLPGFAKNLPLSIASVYGVPSVNGYDPLAEYTAQAIAARQKLRDHPLETCRALGVRWIIAAKLDYYSAEQDLWLTTDDRLRVQDFATVGLPPHDFLDAIGAMAKPVAENEMLTLYEVSDPSPLAFDEAQPAVPLPIRVHGQGADVYLPPSSAARTVVVNFLALPWLRALSAGRPLEALPDDWGRLRIAVPPNVSHLEVRVELSWMRGIGLGCVLYLLTCAGCIAMRKWMR